jgi:hypothetical protein
MSAVMRQDPWCAYLLATRNHSNRPVLWSKSGPTSVSRQITQPNAARKRRAPKVRQPKSQLLSRIVWFEALRGFRKGPR